MANIIFLLPNLFIMNGNSILTMMEVTIGMDIISVASDSANGPLGNFVSFFCSSTKLTAAHPFIAPNDAVSKWPGKNHVINIRKIAYKLIKPHRKLWNIIDGISVP